MAAHGSLPLVTMYPVFLQKSLNSSSEIVNGIFRCLALWRIAFNVYVTGCLSLRSLDRHFQHSLSGLPELLIARALRQYFVAHFSAFILVFLATLVRFFRQYIVNS